MTFFQNFKTKIIIFEYFPKNSFINELHTPLLPYFNTQHLICDIFIMFVGGSKGHPQKMLDKVTNVHGLPEDFLSKGQKGQRRAGRQTYRQTYRVVLSAAFCS